MPMPVVKKSHKKWWLLGLVPVVGFVVVAGVRLSMSGIGVDLDHPPQFIQTDFLDLSQVYNISKFRSAEGHDFSGNGETCRSMKHYYKPQLTAADLAAMQARGGEPPAPDGKTDWVISSPVDGRIVELQSERSGHGTQVYIVPDRARAFVVRIFHVYVDAGVRASAVSFLGAGGMKVKAGQRLGVIPAKQGTDVAVEAGMGTRKYVSYFAVMPDTVFAAYQARGVKSRDDFIISRAWRDAHPVPCNQDERSDQKFQYPAGYDHGQDEVHLSGYKQPEYGQQGPGNGGAGNGGSAGVPQNYGNNVPAR